MSAQLAGLAGVLLGLAACTSIGGWSARPADIPAGPPTTLRVCARLDPTVPEAQGSRLLDAWQEELRPFRITLAVAWAGPWPRPGYTWRGIAEALTREPLAPGCDRLVVFIGRHLGDAAYGLVAAVLPAPEILGWTDNITMTHAFVVATWTSSLNQAMVGGPTSVMVHEGYHLLGCLHDEPWRACYDTIAALTAQATPAWFPSRGEGGTFTSREDVNAAMQRARWE